MKSASSDIRGSSLEGVGQVLHLVEISGIVGFFELLHGLQEGHCFEVAQHHVEHPFVISETIDSICLIDRLLNAKLGDLNWMLLNKRLLFLKRALEIHIK